MNPVNGCPDDYAELFEQYFPMMIGVVSRSHIAPEDVEDVAMDILARFIDKDGISYYDPDHLHDVGENPEVPGARLRKAKFRGMLRGFTATYVMQYRDKQMLRHRREPWRNESPVRVGAGGGTVPWIEFNAEEDESSIIDVEVSADIVAAIKKARELLVARNTKKRDYGTFIDQCVEAGYLEGSINRLALCESLGVSGSTVNIMLKDFRETLKPLLAAA